MWHKQQDIHQEGKKGDEKGRKKEDQKRQKVARRMRRAMEMRSDGHAETYESEEGGHRMDNQDGG
jgi:hypothetical protein